MWVCLLGKDVKTLRKQMFERHSRPGVVEGNNSPMCQLAGEEGPCHTAACFRPLLAITNVASVVDGLLLNPVQLIGSKPLRCSRRQR